MLRKNYEANWQRKKQYLIRTTSQEPLALSPIRESDETKSSGASPTADGATTLPELIIERVPKHRDCESARFYDHLRKRMRKYYRKIFNLRTDDSSSGTEFDEELYDEYNPTNTKVTHQDDLNVSYVIEQLDRESDLRDKSTLYLGSLSSRKDSSEKERVSVSKSSGSEKKQIDKAHPAINKDRVRETKKNDKSEDSAAGKGREEDSHVEEKSADDEMETEEESDQLGDNQDGERETKENDESEDSASKGREEDSHVEEKSADDEMETEEESDQLGDNQEECDVEEESSKEECERNDSKSNQMSKSQDIEEEESERDEKASDQSPEELEIMRSYNPAPSIDSMRHEAPSDTEENTSLNRFTHRHSLPQNEAESSGDLAPEIQATDDDDELNFLIRTSTPRKTKEMETRRPSHLVHEEQATAKKRYFRNIPIQTDEIEKQASYINVAVQTDCIRHFGIQTEEKPAQNEAESPGTVAPEIQAADDDNELNFLIRTSTPRKTKETGTKRPSDLVHEEQVTAKKRYFRNIRLQTDEIEKQVSSINIAVQTDCVHVRHLGIQTEEKPAVKENVGTQTDLPLGHYRDIGIQVASQKGLRSIEVQTVRNLSEFTNIEIQTDGTEVEQRDAETQTDLPEEGVDVGVQTDEKTEEERRREDRFEFIERRGIFFFFF